MDIHSVMGSLGIRSTERMVDAEHLPIFQFTTKKALDHHRGQRFGINLENVQRGRTQSEHHKQRERVNWNGQRQYTQNVVRMTVIYCDNGRVQSEGDGSCPYRGDEYIATAMCFERERMEYHRQKDVEHQCVRKEDGVRSTISIDRQCFIAFNHEDGSQSVIDNQLEQYEH